MWHLLFALIYAMFLDRWTREVLLDGALDCEEIDALRRSMISLRFIAFIVLLFGLAMALTQIPLLKIPVMPWLPEIIVWSAAAAPFALLLPSLSAGEPLSLSEAWSAGKPSFASLFMLIGGAALLSLLAATAATEAGLHLLPGKPWAGAVVAGTSRLVDCLLLTFVGYGLTGLFLERTGWQQPTPEDHAYRAARARKA